jgi:hypothetical protein
MRRLLIAAGALLMAYAMSGALLDSEVNKAGVAVFLAAVVVAHDGLFMPIVLAAGRVVRSFWVPAVISLPVLVVGLPLALGFGRSPDNPSALPLPYARNLIVTVGLIWLSALLARAVRAIRRHPAIRKRSERRRTAALRHRTG